LAAEKQRLDLYCARALVLRLTDCAVILIANFAARHAVIIIPIRRAAARVVGQQRFLSGRLLALRRSLLGTLHTCTVPLGASFDILEVRDGVALFRNPAQTMEKLAALIPGLGQAEGLDDFWAGAIQDGKNGMIPVYLPNLLDHRAKLLDLPQINRIVNEQIPNLPDGVKKVIVYYVDIEDEKEARAFIREYGSPLVEVELRDLKTVLHEIVLNDEVDYTLTKTAEGGWRVEITRFHSDRLAQKIEAHNQKLQLNAGNKKARQRKLEEAAQESEESLTELTPLEISENGLELIELVSLDCTADDGPWHSDAEIKIDKKGYVIRDGVRTKEYWDAAISSSRKPLRLKIRNIAGDETVVRVE
jgi:adenine-specific DNA-methyltransferase